MQYQKFIEKSYKGDFSSYPLNFHSYFEGDLFSTDPLFLISALIALWCMGKSPLGIFL